MNGTTYLVSRMTGKAVCENNSNDFWCKPLGEKAIILILLFIALYFILLDMIGFYKKSEYSKKNKILIFFLYFLKFPKRFYLFLKDAYKDKS